MENWNFFIPKKNRKTLLFRRRWSTGINIKGSL